MTNIQLNPGFSQVCVWPGTVLGKVTIDEFITFFKDEMDVRVQYLEEVLTAPDIKNGRAVSDTGGRNDLFFAVHNDDVIKFAVPRLEMGIRWIEDVYGNGGGHLYPDRIAHYMTWDGYLEEFLKTK